jgi:hypothetical protein
MRDELMKKYKYKNKNTNSLTQGNFSTKYKKRKRRRAPAFKKTGPENGALRGKSF